jgi:hypothetical protein
MNDIPAIEAQINDLSERIFGSRELNEQTEFHAAAIYFSKFPTRNWKISKRLEVLEALLVVLTSSEKIRRVYASIDSSKLYTPEKAGEYAFAHFCERTQMLVGANSTTLLIGDMDTHKNAQTIREFSQYRAQGTPWEYGIQIKSIADCVHFARSHHSRMVQLADAYLFAASHNTSGRSGDMALEFDKILNKFNLTLTATNGGPTRIATAPAILPSTGAQREPGSSGMSGRGSAFPSGMADEPGHDN